jgi:hypothetical protein
MKNNGSSLNKYSGPAPHINNYSKDMFEGFRIQTS